MHLDTKGAPSSTDTATEPGLAEVRESDRKIVDIPVGRLRLSPTDPRTGEDVDVSDLDIGEDKGDGKREPVRAALWVRTRSATVMGEEYFEIIDGGRRWRKSCAVGLTHVPCEIRDDLSDLEVRRLQLLQNGQRQDLSHMQKACAYGALREEYSWDVAEIALQLHVSDRDVRQGLALLTLIPEGQEEVRKKDGIFARSIGAALALVSVTDPKAQAECLASMRSQAERDGELTASQARWLVRDRFHLRLGGAGFPLDDATLVPKAGACIVCPKKSGAQMAWLDLVDRSRVNRQDDEAERCTDRACFDGKRKAAVDRLKVEAKKTGTQVITGKDAEALFPYSGAYYAGKDKVIDLDKACPLDSKGRSWAELLGDKAPSPSKVVIVEGQKAHRMIGEKEARAALKEVKPKLLEKEKEKRHAATEKAKPSPSEIKMKLERQANEEAGALVLREVRAKASKKKPDVKFWRFLAGLVLREGFGQLENVIEDLGLTLPEAPKKKTWRERPEQDAILKYIDGAEEDALRGLCVSVLCAQDADYLGWIDTKSDVGQDERTLMVASRFLAIDPKAIRDLKLEDIKAKAKAEDAAKAANKGKALSATAKKGALPAAAPKGKKSKPESPKAGKVAAKKSSKAPPAAERDELLDLEHDQAEDMREEADIDEDDGPSCRVCLADLVKTGALIDAEDDFYALPDAEHATTSKLSGFLLAAVADKAHVEKWVESEGVKAGYKVPEIQAEWQRLKDAGEVVMVGKGWKAKPTHEPTKGLDLEEIDRAHRPSLGESARRRMSLAIPPSAQDLARGRFSGSSGIGSIDPEVAQGFRDGIDARIVEATAEKWLTPEAISRELEGIPVAIVVAALERLLAGSKIARVGNTWCSKAPPAEREEPATALPLKLGDRVMAKAGGYNGEIGPVVWIGKGKDAGCIKVALGPFGGGRALDISFALVDVERVVERPPVAPGLSVTCPPSEPTPTDVLRSLVEQGPATQAELSKRLPGVGLAPLGAITAKVAAKGHAIMVKATKAWKATAEGTATVKPAGGGEAA